jgi:hypothetical protein
LLGSFVVASKSSVIIALGVIAASIPSYTLAQTTGSGDAIFAERCEILRGMSLAQLETFVRENPKDPCIEMAALLLTVAQAPVPEPGRGNY